MRIFVLLPLLIVLGGCSKAPVLKYEIKGDTVTITGCDQKASGKLVIPATIEGKTVTSIGHRLDGSGHLYGKGAFFACSSLTSITIPDSVTSIGEEAFQACSSLTSITIPDSVTSIEDETFIFCSSLTSITIGEGVTSIGDQAFRNCTSLTSITFGTNSKLTSIGNDAFMSCSSLRSITIPDSVTSIRGEAFIFCKSLTAVTFLGDIPKVGKGVFADAPTTIYRKPRSKGWGDTFARSPVKLISEKPQEAVSNPNLNYEIKGDAVTITDCYKNASGALTIPATIEGKLVTSIGTAAFSKCSSLTSIMIPDGVTSIGINVFMGCESLTSVTIPDSVTSIGEGAFNYCTNLMSITIPDSVTSIGVAAFSLCKSLTSITIPEGVTSIGDRAFYRCSSLTSITISDSVTSGLGSDPFHECTSLKTIEVSAGNADYTTVNGVLFNEEQTLLIAYPESKSETHYTIPDSVTIIGYGAFSNCLSLTNVTIPDSVESIRSTAFTKCTSLTNIMIPASVTNISPYTFSRCLNLTAVTFLGDPPVLGVSAFENTTSTIYRKTEAKGWGDTFGGRPVKLISEKP